MVCLSARGIHGGQWGCGDLIYRFRYISSQDGYSDNGEM